MNIGVIPARLNSTRFSEKILIQIGGIPMIIQVYRQALKAKKLDRVIVAIDDEKTNFEENCILANFRLFFIFRYFKVVVPCLLSVM